MIIKNLSKLKLITFNHIVYKGNIKAKTAFFNGGLEKKTYKVIEVKSLTIVWNEEKQSYNKESTALCQEMITES
jgi:hypothetical protein